MDKGIIVLFWPFGDQTKQIGVYVPPPASLTGAISTAAGKLAQLMPGLETTEEYVRVKLEKSVHAVVIVDQAHIIYHHSAEEQRE